VFQQVVLDKPYKGTELTLFQWMEQQYLLIDTFLVDTEQRKLAMESFRSTLYETVINTKLDGDFRQQLRASMRKTFGSTRTGVFIRSDTNVEDLPNFTGAGLNLTLFNVVGFNEILKGINKVWASPFSPRAFAWRQMLMDSPQHVYPALLIMQTVANEKSGVMITQDINSGEANILSVAVNEGVGGAVDGPSAESLRIDTVNKGVRLLASATADLRKVPLSRGGIAKLPVSGSERVLEDDEISQLIEFSKALPLTFPSIKNDKGEIVPADIEFGFYKGQLQLFQLRPFLENSNAQNNSYLIDMDKVLQVNMNQSVIMDAVPQ
jgi:phosphoenolpyruvate synthase/pyruvate phosphate dikinase